MLDEVLDSCTVSYFSRIYDANGADRMVTLLQSDLVCVHIVCTYLTVQKLRIQQSIVFPMYIYIEKGFDRTQCKGLHFKEDSEKGYQIQNVEHTA